MINIEDVMKAISPITMIDSKYLTGKATDTVEYEILSSRKRYKIIIKNENILKLYRIGYSTGASDTLCDEHLSIDIKLDMHIATFDNIKDMLTLINILYKGDLIEKKD